MKRFRPFELQRTAKLVLLLTEQAMGKFDLTTLIVKAGAMVFTIMNVFPTISSYFLCWCLHHGAKIATIAWHYSAMRLVITVFIFLQDNCPSCVLKQKFVLWGNETISCH